MNSGERKAARCDSSERRRQETGICTHKAGGDAVVEEEPQSSRVRTRPGEARKAGIEKAEAVCARIEVVGAGLLIPDRRVGHEVGPARVRRVRPTRPAVRTSGCPGFCPCFCLAGLSGCLFV